MLDNPTKVMVEADHTIKVICYVNEDVMSREFHNLLYRYFLTICMPHDNINFVKVGLMNELHSQVESVNFKNIEKL